MTKLSSQNNLRKFRRHSGLKSLKAFRWALRYMPLWFTQLCLECVFPVAYAGVKKLRHICIKNLQTVFGKEKNPDELKGMTKRCIKNIAYCMIDMLYYVERLDKLDKIVNFHNEKYLSNALQQGRGVIAVTAHLGNFPLMFLCLARKGYKVNVIIRPMRNQNFSRFVYNLSEIWDINMIETLPKKKFINESLNALKKNELLFFLLDEFVPEKVGVTVDFFNTKVRRASGPLLFHQRVRSPIIPIFITKNKSNNFEIFVEPDLKIDKEFNKDKNRVKNIARITDIIETFVRKYPVQWGGWLNKRWAA